MTERKSRLRPHEATEEESSVTEVTEEEEDSEVAETEIMGSETIEEDPEEISLTEVTDPRDVSTAARTAISPEIATNVLFTLISARKPREFNRDRPDRTEDRGGYKKRSRSRSGDRHKKSRKRSSSNSSRS